MDSTDTNAVAGPSNLRTSSPRSNSPSRRPTTPHFQVEPISLFLPPPGPPQSAAYIQSTQDLLGRFHLHEAYDKYVRPYINTPPDSAALNTIASSPSNLGPNGTGLSGSLDKGKGKEVVPPSIAQTPAQDAQDLDDDDGGKGEKKKKNSYKHLIKGVPGKHSMKKDDYLTTLLQIPPKQYVPISEFDSRTQRDAFTVSLEGLKGWNPSALVLVSAQAREDRKKRKELKRLAKAQIQAQSQSQVPTQQSSPVASTPIQAPVPTSATSSLFPLSAPTPARPSAVSSTPRPTGPSTPTPRPHPAAATTAAPIATRPSSTKPGLPPVQIPPPGVRVSTPLRTATPTGPHPLSAPPLSASTIAPPIPAPNTVPLTPRGKKRERDEVQLPPGSGNGSMAASVNINGTTAAVSTATNTSLPPQAIINARAGTNGVRPRPIKKQRMDSQGVGRDTAPVQQHTPA
ncbi:hypothetical protein GYMLUDRAFT_95679 [Collybiopsis luxurians FD-317 M1]|uniref:Mediator of RNA polymerase II transcription subunit 19 n=1 Tax=Collybiopsis luxurians FD-317 M1 TaxID=944289 RepID=A0A0D0C4I8_9AGAR|nr:hypothetical protein GYMLUDRAFT_95679 [Collybiopsis luxurians FD-317 M1]